MLLYPGLRKLISSKIQQLFNTASFDAPLTHSLALNRGTGSATFTRATTKTVTGYGPTANSGDSQVLLTCAAGEAGFTGARRISEGVWSDTFADGSPIPASTLDGISIRAAATNLQQFSNLFSSWNNSGTPSAAQNAIGPDGGTTGWTLTDNDGAATEFKYRTSASALTAAAYTGSIFIKKTTGAQSSYPVIFIDSGTNSAAVTVDTTNGVVTQWTAYTGRTINTTGTQIVSHNDDYWRVGVTFTGTAASWTTYAIPAGATSATYAGPAFVASAQGSAVFANAQLELGSFMTPYIDVPSTTAVARNLDLESTPTASNVAAAASSVYLEYTPDHAPSGTVFLWGTYVDASNYTAILHDGTNLIMRKRIAATNYDATIANAFTVGTTYKAVGTWGAGGVTITLNGTEGTPHANTTAAQIGSTMETGGDGNGASQPGMSFKNVRITQRQYSASERLAVTQ